MFDKAAYWKRRKAGKRGQEDLSPLKVTRVTGMKGAINRARSRRKLVDREKTKAGYKYGFKIGGKAFNMANHKLKHFIGREFGTPIITETTDKNGKTTVSTRYSFPAKTRHLRSDSEELRRHLEKSPLLLDPSKTNKMRFEARKEKRDADRAERASTSSKTAAV